MAKSVFAFMVTFLLTAVTAGAPCRAAVESELEVGDVFVGRNDVRTPGSGGTAISFSDDLQTDPAPVFRVRLGYRFRERHLITALYAPLQLIATASAGRSSGGKHRSELPAAPLAARRTITVTTSVHYFLTHTSELVAIGGVGAVFGAGWSTQTTITTDNGQFKTLSTAYFAKPAPLP